MSTLHVLLDPKNARRRLTDVTPHEVSLVDTPAILRHFVVRKNKDNQPVVPAPIVPAPVVPAPAAPEVAAIVKDLKDLLAQKGFNLLEGLQAAGVVPAVVPAPIPAAPPPAAPVAPTVSAPVDAIGIAKAAAAEVMKELIAAGVVKAPPTPAEQVQKFQVDVRKTFETLGVGVVAIAERLEALEKRLTAGQPVPGSQQVAPVPVPVVPVAVVPPPSTPGAQPVPTQVTKTLGKGGIYNDGSVDEPLVLGMIFPGAVAQA